MGGGLRDRVGVVGGGLVGLAVARRLARDGHEVEVFEKETAVATHQSGRNSGVVHAGVYYAPGSLKAALCRRGVGLLREFCAQHGLVYREIGKALTLADAVLVTDVYGAGEMPQPGVNGKLIVDAVCESLTRPDVYYIPDQHDIPSVLRAIAEPKDTILTMGAGDISRVGDELLSVLSS